MAVSRYQTAPSFPKQSLVVLQEQGPLVGRQSQAICLRPRLSGEIHIRDTKHKAQSFGLAQGPIVVASPRRNALEIICDGLG
jgi:hypothetical protein